MPIDYKAKTKRLLEGSAVKLFFISLTSLLLRYGSIFIACITLLYAVKSRVYLSLTKTLGELPVAIIFYILCALVFSLCILLFFGIRLGENMCFFEKANGKPISLKKLFKYLSPYTCTQGALLYAKIYVYKLLWLLLFATPCLACICCLQLLLWQGLIEGVLYYILSLATSIVISVSVIMWRISALRYSVAPYYFCIGAQKDSKKAIRQSIASTDKLLLEAIGNEIFLFYKALSCIFILPIGYKLMYIKLFKVVFITDAIDNRLKILGLCQNID